MKLGGLPKLSLSGVHSEFSELAEQERHQKRVVSSSADTQLTKRREEASGEKEGRGSFGPPQIPRLNRGPAMELDLPPPLTSRTSRGAAHGIEDEEKTALISTNRELKKKLAVYAETITTYEARCQALEDEIRSLKENANNHVERAVAPAEFGDIPARGDPNLVVYAGFYPVILILGMFGHLSFSVIIKASILFCFKILTLKFPNHSAAIFSRSRSSKMLIRIYGRGRCLCSQAETFSESISVT
ncbi:hypothetical protein PROFUN_01859 [Planoprotostelium fungivorum]|uniref:Uncharacterized protein n=1 Tax=Planoprotostelium fungivorum TaxID=1890364 RepID=A0A2P6NYX4_9EUKA|nr:hypothetical protein PROFUN_01859 [Planoprotostelium fungivorum]